MQTDLLVVNKIEIGYRTNVKSAHWPSKPNNNSHESETIKSESRQCRVSGFLSVICMLSWKLITTTDNHKYFHQLSFIISIWDLCSPYNTNTRTHNHLLFGKCNYNLAACCISTLLKQSVMMMIVGCMGIAKCFRKISLCYNAYKVKTRNAISLIKRKSEVWNCKV